MDDAMNKNHLRYLEWKNKNLDVFQKIQETAYLTMKRGVRFSMDQVVHHVRFKVFFEGYRDAPFRINNNHVAYIARDLILSFPRMAQYVRTRKVKGEDRNGSMPRV